MTKSAFIRELAEILGESPEALSSPDTELATFAAWDSVAYLATMVLFDEKLGVAVRPDAISKARTLGDLFKLAPGFEDG